MNYSCKKKYSLREILVYIQYPIKPLVGRYCSVSASCYVVYLKLRLFNTYACTYNYKADMDDYSICVNMHMQT